MIHRRSLTIRPALLALAALVVLAAAPPANARRAAGPPADAATCAAARVEHGGRLIQRVLRCNGAAAAKGRRAPRSCLKQSIVQFAKGLKRVDRAGTCATGAEALFAATQYGALAQATAEALRPERKASRCAAGKLQGTANAAADIMAATAQARRDYVIGTLATALGAAGANLEGAFAAAELRGNCQTTGDFLDVLLLIHSIAGTAGPLLGRVELAKSIDFPAGAREDVVANRATLEAQGATVADDGSSLVGPPTGAAGWIAVLGDQAVRLDATGSFVLAVPLGQPLEGQLYHPANRTTPVARFFVIELAGISDPAPTVIPLEVRTPGACGMNRDPADDPPSCHAALGGIAPRLAAPHGIFRLNPDPGTFPPKVDGELGTYPNPDPAARQSVCLDYNGYIQTGERGDGSIKGAIAYPGSTCQMQVDVGCCDNEAATIRRRILFVIDDFSFPILHCPDNHTGDRFCQSVTKGDLAVRVNGQVARDGQTLDFTLAPGENVQVTVHNNGCYGETHVSPGLFNDAGGVLAGPRFDGETLKHFDLDYVADSELTYFANADCPSENASDKYDFETDGSEATVIFRCTPPTTTTTTCPGFEFSCSATTTTLP